MQSWCNHKILVQLKNTRAGVYRTRRKSSARLLSNCPGLPGLHRAITIPQYNNRASFYILSSTESGASRQSVSSYQKHSTTRNSQSDRNPGAITKSKCNQRTYGPEYIEPGQGVPGSSVLRSHQDSRIAWLSRHSRGSNSQLDPKHSFLTARTYPKAMAFPTILLQTSILLQSQCNLEIRSQ